MTRALLASLLVLSAACGDDGDDSGSSAPDAAPGSSADAAPGGTDAPPGGSSLLVQGAITVDNDANVDGEAAGMNRRVRARIVVTRDGAPVDNAIIRLIPSVCAVQTFLSGEATEPNVYTGQYTHYCNDTLRIEIKAGDDDLGQTLLLGQSMFRISTPTAGAEIGAGASFEVTWSTPGSVADVLTVSTEEAGYSSGELTDASSFTVPGGVIGDGDGTETVHVYRAQRNELLGAAAGSFIDFGVDTALGITVVTP